MPSGAEETVRGVTIFEGVEATEDPAEFEAVTIKRYPTPLVNPVMVHVVALVVWQVNEPSSVLARYPVTAVLPELLGADQETVAEPSPAFAVTALARVGTIEGAALAIWLVSATKSPAIKNTLHN